MRWTGAVLTLAALAAPAGAQVFADILLQERGTPHSEARLISETGRIVPGEPFTVGIHIALDPGWHTYWENAGDAGNGLVAQWTLPHGFSAGPLQYPRPQRVPYPPLMNYGYYDEVVVLTEITPPAGLEAGQRVTLAVDAEWLVCEEICIPVQDRLTLELAVGGEAASADAALVERFGKRLPVTDAGWGLRAARTDGGFVLAARPPDGWTGSLAGAYFFPSTPSLLEHTAPQPAGTRDGEVRLRLTESPFLADEPESLEGLLTLPEGSGFDETGSGGLVVMVPVERDEEAVAWALEPTTHLADPARAGSGPAGGLSLLVALFFAFVGGLILNLMPCVFPILSLKALGFATRGGDRAGMRRDGLAFGSGVVLTFLVVAAVLLGIRATGAEVGWGYQLQSPTLVALLAALMFGIGLILAGVVDVGTSLTRLGGLGGGGGPGKGTGSSFFTGVLATVVATPCTAPFMGAAIGAALVRPPVEGLTVFAGLGAGMATPYVLLAFWPSLAARLPRPGRWMETFKQLLAFPMFAVAIWLVWVFGLQVGVDGAGRLLFGLLLLAMAAWLVGRWPAAASTSRTRLLTRGLATAVVVVAVVSGAAATRGEAPVAAPAGVGGSGGDGGASLVWETFSEAAVLAHRQAGRPVFVDFTAAWCLSCKVNERVALETGVVRRAFAEHDVALLKADWTRRDPAITRALASFGRSGVPLYVLYPADPLAEPRLLPALLTQKTVLDAVREAAASGASGAVRAGWDGR